MRVTLCCLLTLCLALLARSAHAVESAPVQTERAIATLVADADSYRPGAPIRVGLRLRLAPGWHTYWRNPGDAGAAPELTLSLPPGAQAGPIAWPAPERAPEDPFITYAYTGDVVLPVTVTPPVGGSGPLAIAASANWLVCAKICVPEQGAFRLVLPAGAGSPSAEAPLFTATDARMPRPAPFEAHRAPDGSLVLSGPGLAAEQVAAAWFFPNDWGVIDQNAAQPLRAGDGELVLGLRPAVGARPEGPLRGVLSLTGADGATRWFRIDAAPGKASSAASGTASGAAAMPTRAAGTVDPIARALGLAVLGGLLLNLMPCVFPVLALKAMGIARLGGRNRWEIRLHALAYVAGVLVTFGAFGAVVTGLRALGHWAGWGFQFQSATAVAVLAWLLFGIGLNLSGVFDVSGRFAGAGQSLAARHGHLGSFFTGLLAVVVATPCTAPFMASALAAAAAAPWAETLGVFLALGLGLALPYALLALVPRLGRLLPRPGAWMETLRQALAFPMYGACVWLVWVISRQGGSDGVLAAGAGLLLVGMAAWLAGRAQQGRLGRGRVGALAAAACLLAVLALLPVLGAAAPGGVARLEAGTEPFSPARLAALRAARRPVFVNMTAAWCVTCLVNERVALSRQVVRDAFAAHGVAYLKGDWTSGDPAVTAFLRENGRDGVPLYLLYPASGPPATLPQILTESTMLDAVAHSGG